MARLRAPERKRQLLEVAATLFAQRGYHGTTTAALAEAAGVTEPILYRHFKDKADLFGALVSATGDEVIAAWQASLEGVDDPAERLRILLAGNPATHERGKGVYRVIFQAMTERADDRTVAKALRAHFVTIHAFIRDEIENLQHQQLVRDDEPAAALAWLLVDIAVGFGMVSPIKAPGHSVGTERTAVQRLIEDLLTT